MVDQREQSATAADPSERDAAIARLTELLGERSTRELALVTRLVTGFPQKAAGLVEHWRISTLQGRSQEAARAVHTLRGAALNLGSLTLSRVCEQVESGCHDGSADETNTAELLLTTAITGFVTALSDAATVLGPMGLDPSTPWTTGADSPERFPTWRPPPAPHRTDGGLPARSGPSAGHGVTPPAP